MKKYIDYLAFDFDCVIASYKRPFKFDILGKPNYEVIETMQYFSKLGYYILIFTGRVCTPKMEKWLKKYNIPYDGFNVQPKDYLFASKYKPYYSMIMDDKAINYHYKYNKKTPKEMIKEIKAIINRKGD